MSDERKQDRELSIPSALSGFILWIIAFGGLIGSLSNPEYLIAAAIASGFLFQKCK
jgi:hypothetical protein